MRKLILPVALMLAVLGLGGRVPTLVDRPAGAEAAGVNLTLSTGYVVISPISRALDALTLLSTQQSIALFVTIAAIVVIWLMLRRASLKRIGLAVATALVIIGILEAAAAFLPRPMASLTASDPDLVRIDFHSHTASSHDVRKSFSVEDNRAWHRAGGFDVAYITDHVKFDGAEAATARNPRIAGDGVSLVTGMEGRYHRIMSTVVLGITSLDSANLNSRGNILPGDLRSPRQPVTIIAIPNRNLDSLSARVLDSVVALPNLSAIELVDAAPRGLAQLDREEAKIRKLAADLRLALVAASNNHGYGRTVAGWNLMRIAGWRGMSPDSLAASIENQLRSNRQGVRIVHRTRPWVSGYEAAATLPLVIHQTVGGLTLPERMSWIAWILGISGITFALRRRSAR